LTEAQVKAKLERAFAGWKVTGQKVAAPAPPAFNPAKNGLRVFLVDKPGAVQTVIRFVMPAPVFASPLRQTLLSLNTILGGAFTSRLNQNIRESHGYAYGAGSSYSFGPTVGTLVATSDVRSDVTGASIQEFLAEFKRLKSGDISEEEARKAASTRRAELVATLGSLSGLLSVAEVYEENGRPFAEFGNGFAEIAKLSAADLNRTADAAIPLDQAVLVLVGDKATILKQLQGLGLPKPEEVKANP
jgi:predicted Zn-dependent peptidase